MITRTGGVPRTRDSARDRSDYNERRGEVSANVWRPTAPRTAVGRRARFLRDVGAGQRRKPFDEGLVVGGDGERPARECSSPRTDAQLLAADANRCIRNPALVQRVEDGA